MATPAEGSVDVTLKVGTDKIGVFVSEDRPKVKAVLGVDTPALTAPTEEAVLNTGGAVEVLRVGATVVKVRVVLTPKCGDEEMPNAEVGGGLENAGMLNVGAVLVAEGGRGEVGGAVEGAEKAGVVELKAD